MQYLVFTTLPLYEGDPGGPIIRLVNANDPAEAERLSSEDLGIEVQASVAFEVPTEGAGVALASWLSGNGGAFVWTRYLP